MKMPILTAISAIAAAAIFVSCDTENTENFDIQDVTFEFPDRVLAGERVSFILSERVENAVLCIGGMEFSLDSGWENDEGKFSFSIEIPADFKGEYDVTVKSLAGDAEEVEIGNIGVWQIEQGQDYSTSRPVSMDISGAVLLINSCKVTMDKIEKLEFSDKDGRPVVATLSSEQAISTLYSSGTVSYCSEYELVCPDDGTYMAYKEYGSEIEVPVIIRNSDGIMLPIHGAENPAGIYSVSENVFYFTDRDLSQPVRKATVDADLFPASKTDLPDDIMERSLYTEELRGSEGKVVRNVGNIQLIATPDGKVYFSGQHVYNGNNTIEMDLTSGELEQPDCVLAIGNNIVAVKATWKTELYSASVGDRSGYWHKFKELDEPMLGNSAVVYGEKAYIMCPDKYYIVDNTLNVTEHEYFYSPGDADGQYNPGCPRTESWWYFYDANGFGRVKLEDLSTSGPEYIGDAPQFMFHSLGDVAVWNTDDMGRIGINIIAGGNRSTVTDTEGLLSGSDMSYDKGAITNTLFQENTPEVRIQ